MRTAKLYILLWVSLLMNSSFVMAVNEQEYQKAVQSWNKVLQQYVDNQGRTDFITLAKSPQDLKFYVDFVARVSPTTHPELFKTKELILAYHINTYNALAMYGVLDRGIPKAFDGFFKRASFFKFRKIIIGGKKTSLYDYENKVIRPLNEPRAHFALNCMVKDCPRLPQRAFVAEKLDEDLNKLTYEFFSKPKHLRRDQKKKTVYVSAILDFYTKDFVPSGKASDLGQYINQYVTDPIPDSFRIKFIDYDWTINQQP